MLYVFVPSLPVISTYKRIIIRRVLKEGKSGIESGVTSRSNPLRNNGELEYNCVSAQIKIRFPIVVVKQVVFVLAPVPVAPQGSGKTTPYDLRMKKGVLDLPF